MTEKEIVFGLLVGLLFLVLVSAIPIIYKNHRRMLEETQA